LEGASKCEKCALGTAQVLLGSIQCDPCPFGSSTGVVGQAICVEWYLFLHVADILVCRVGLLVVRDRIVMLVPTPIKRHRQFA
jgi:hypothetical protein